MTINIDILKNSAGLVMWLDGEINSRAGVRDTSVKGMQNLVHIPYAGKSTTTGFNEVLGYKPIFNDDKSITLTGRCDYPMYQVDDFTLAWCIKFTPRTSSGYTRHSIYAASPSGGGFWNCVDVYKDKIIVNLAGYNSGGISLSTQTKTGSVQVTSESGTINKLYFTVSGKLTQSNTLKLYVNGELKSEAKDGVGAVASKLGNGSCLGGNAGISSFGSAFSCDGDRFYTVKLWNRQLSEKEILDNYKRDFERFGE